MRRLMAIGTLAVALAGCAAPPAAQQTGAETTAAASTPSAGWENAATLTAFFGRNAAAHPVDPERGRAAPRQVELVSEADWEAFHRAEVLPRLLRLRPEGNGFTLLEAIGHWQGRDQTTTVERNKVITIVVPLYALPAAQSAMVQIAAAYARRFHQESVLLTLSLGQRVFQGATADGGR